MNKHNQRRPRTNRVDFVSWSGAVQSQVEILAWRISIYQGGGGKTITLNGCVIDGNYGPIVIGGAYDDFGRPINTLLSGVVTMEGQCLVVVEYLDPDIASLA